jgi:hypothetical protein
MDEPTNLKTTKSSYQSSSVKRLHHRLLFHWVGSHIDKRTDLTVDEKRTKYIESLKESLIYGLWLKKPREKDSLMDGKFFTVNEPICCFTETPLSEVINHAKTYGKMGFGFPKRFVLEKGGKPVNYVLDSKTDPTMQAWLRMAEVINDPNLKSILSKRQATTLESDFNFLGHFLKKIKKTPKKVDDGEKRAGLSGEPETSKVKKKSLVLARSFGSPLHYYEEREWRFVYQKNGKSIIPRGAVPNINSEQEIKKPDYYLPYTIGKDLFAIVFPDNQTMAMALSDSLIREMLLPTNQPQVTLMSFEDIGSL